MMGKLAAKGRGMIANGANTDLSTVAKAREASALRKYFWMGKIAGHSAGKITITRPDEPDMRYK